MKFTDGFWLMQKEYSLHPATQIVDYRIGDRSLTLFAATKKINHRGDTLDDGLLTLTFSSPAADIIHVNVTHFDGAYEKGPHFALNQNVVPVTITDGETLIFSSGQTRVEIDKSEWNLNYYFGSRLLTASSWRSTAYISSETGGYIREQLDLGINEQVYGLGERFAPFVKNGQSVDIWNEDGGTASEQSYKSIPFYLSSNGYGVFTNHPERVSYEVASEVVSRVQFSVKGEHLDYFVIGGNTPKDVLVKYTDLTGKPALPPLWSFGLWLSTSFTTNYDEETVNSFLDKMEAYEIPLSVFHYDCFWMKGYEWTNFEWDPNVFPEPVAMLKRLKEKGLKICVWINPYIAQKSPLFQEGKAKGYLLKNLDGNVWQWNKWQAGMGIVDFTNPDATAWYQSHLRKLMDMGVDSFKTDFGERIPVDVAYFDGSDPEKMHNYYTHLYNEAVFAVLQEQSPQDALVFARSATVGGQKFPVHWGGDCSSNYASMAESLRGGLSLTLSGFGFWSHDISGFENTATPDVYKRWSQFGLLSTHSRLHGNTSYRVPWDFGQEAVDVVRYFSQLKCQLAPYLFNSAIATSITGLPSMSAMMLQYPEDNNCRYLDLQYMLGDDVLVAPIFNEQGLANYYLPAGSWTHLISNEVKTGGAWFEETHDYFSLPLYVAENTILPLGTEKTRIDYSFKDNLVVHCYQIVDASYDLHDEQGNSLGTIHAYAVDGGIAIEHTLGSTLQVKVFAGNQVIDASVEGKKIIEY